MGILIYIQYLLKFIETMKNLKVHVLHLIQSLLMLMGFCFAAVWLNNCLNFISNVSSARYEGVGEIPDDDPDFPPEKKVDSTQFVTWLGTASVFGVFYEVVFVIVLINMCMLRGPHKKNGKYS